MRGAHIVLPAVKIHLRVFTRRITRREVVESEDIATRTRQALREYAEHAVRAYGLAAEGIAQEHAAARCRHAGARMEEAEQSSRTGVKIKRLAHGLSSAKFSAGQIESWKSL